MSEDDETIILTTVKVSTGETRHVVLDPAKVRKRKERKEPALPFASLLQEGAKQLRETDGLQGFDFKLFLHLWSVMRYQNYLTINPPALAHELKVNRVQVYRGIKRLVDTKVLFRGDDDVTYRLSPRIGYRGTRLEQKQAISELDTGIFQVIAGGPI